MTVAAFVPGTDRLATSGKTAWTNTIMREDIIAITTPAPKVGERVVDGYRKTGRLEFVHGEYGFVSYGPKDIPMSWHMSGLTRAA